MIKVIAMDFDNTLVHHTNVAPIINPELIEWLNGFIKQGNHAGIVSGRNYYEMKSIYESLGFKWGELFPSFVIAKEAYIYINEKYYEERNHIIEKRTSALMKNVTKFLSEWLDEFENAGLTVCRWSIYSDFALEVFFENADQADVALEILKGCIKKSGIEGCHLHRNGRIATIIDKKSGKGNALFDLSQALDVKPEEVLAIGDSLNDLSMLNGDKGFVCATMENGDEIIKEAVRKSGGYIGKGIACDGVLDVLNKNIKEMF